MTQSQSFWKCWQCGGQHPMVRQKCPNGSPVYEGAPTRTEMAMRWQVFAVAYSVKRPAWAEALKKEMRT